MTLAICLAIFVGLSVGLLGAGGSLLAVPILKYAALFNTQQAVATSLVTVGTVSALGVGLAAKEGRVRFRLGLAFASMTVVGTWVGVQIASKIGDTVQMSLFVGILLLAIFRMLGKRNRPDSHHTPDVAAPAGLSQRGVAALKAFTVGILTGLVGVGGGFLIVPALVTLFGLPMKQATGTSLLVIVFSSCVGVLGYSSMVRFDWLFSLKFCAMATLGLVLGFQLSKQLSGKRLSDVFVAMLIVVCGFILSQEIV